MYGIFPPHPPGQWQLISFTELRLRIHEPFSIQTQSKTRIQTMMATSRCDWPWWKTYNRWHSIDAHFHDGAGSVSLSCLRIKAANDLFMTICNLSPPRLPKIHLQELLTLRWHPFSRWGRECFTFSFASKGSQYFVYNYWQPLDPQITQDTWPRIVDAPLKLICWM